jgi:hypothetical protein
MQYVIVFDYEKGILSVLNYQIHHAEPAMFPPFDPTDIAEFNFDWRTRMYFGNRIIWATIYDVPEAAGLPHLHFLTDALIAPTADWVSIVVGEFTPLYVPVMHTLRCSVEFASGDRSTWSVPVQIRSL